MPSYGGRGSGSTLVPVLRGPSAQDQPSVCPWLARSADRPRGACRALHQSCPFSAERLRGFSLYPSPREQTQAVLVGASHPQHWAPMCGSSWKINSKTKLEEGMATHSGVLAWRIPWTEEPGGLRSVRSQRVRHEAGTKQGEVTFPLTHLVLTDSGEADAPGPQGDVCTSSGGRRQWGGRGAHPE